MTFVSKLLITISLSILLAGCASPLYQASARGDLNSVKTLLDAGADVNQRSGGGLLNDSTALDAASITGRTEIVKLLLAKGADVNAEHGTMGWTALSSAAWNGYTDIVNILIDHGADVNRAISALDQGVGTHGAIELLQRAQRERLSSPGARKVPAETAQSADAVTSDVDQLPPAKVKRNDNYAVVVGIENYRQKLPRAEFAAHDAQSVTGYLTKVMGYREENVVTLLNDRALKSDLEKYIERWLPNNVEKGSTVFVYFSGHGAPSTRTADAYLVPYDGDPSFIEETGYSLNRMYAALGKLPAKDIVVALDSCFSGAGGRSVVAKGARPLVISRQASVALPNNLTVLSAASGDQISSTYDEKGHGLFTYFMLKGIKEEMLARPAAAISFRKLFGYLKPEVQRVARKQYNNEQSPQIIEPERKQGEP